MKNLVLCPLFLKIDILLLLLSVLNTSLVFASNLPCTDLFSKEAKSPAVVKLIQTSKKYRSHEIEVTVDDHTITYLDTTRDLSGMKQAGGRNAQRFFNFVESSSGRFLDAGTSEGFLVEDLRKRGLDAIGVDIALREHMQGKSHYIESDIRNLPFPDGYFENSICAFNVFHYATSLKFRIEAMQELIRVTSGNILLVGVTGHWGDRQMDKFGIFESVDIHNFIRELIEHFQEKIELVSDIDITHQGAVLEFRVK